MKFSTSSVVGSAKESKWSQAQTINLAESDQIMVVVQLTCLNDSDLIDLATIGGQVFLEFEKYNGGTTSVEQVKEVVDAIVAEIHSGVGIHILAAYLQGTRLSVYGRGEMVAYLMRMGKLANLCEHFGEGSLVVGEIKMKDRLFLSTTTLVEAIGLGKIKELLRESESPSESLAPLVHMQSETSGMAALLGQMVEQREIKIRLSRGEPRKINLWIGGGILLLLTIMIGVGMVRRANLIAERDYINLDKSVTQKTQETLSIGDLNPERARILLMQAREEVNAYLSTNLKPQYKIKGRQLSVLIETTENKAFKKNDVQLSTIVELSILADGLMADKMRGDGKDSLLFLDTKSSRIVQMNLTDRSRLIVPTKDEQTMRDVGVEGVAMYGLIDQGVVSISMKKQELKRVIQSDEFWQKPTFLGVFAGNVYVMDQAQNEVWKYPTLGDTFGGRRRWFAAGIMPDLSNVVDMKVNGDIWFLTSSGKLVRYSRGAPVAFSMDGFPAKGEAKILIDPVAVYPTSSLIYVLERGATRIVVFGNDGSYKAQYTNVDFGKASDLVIQDGKAYVLVDNTVKSFDL